MSIIAITEHHHLHTCPADPDPHPVIITRQIVHTTPGRSCHTPVTVRIGDTTVTLPCGRHEPHHRQCGACRTVVTTLSITRTDHGHHGSATTAPSLLDTV